jgi:hypothetical protein
LNYIVNVIPHLLVGLSTGLFPSGFHTKTLYAPLFFPIRATCPAHLILLDLITGIIFGEEYKRENFITGNFFMQYYYNCMVITIRLRLTAKLGEEGFPRYGIRSTSYWVGTGSKVTGA